MTDRIVAGGHIRVRPFNTRDTYPEQNLDNDLCQGVVAGNTVYLRGQVAQDLDSRESVAVGDPAGQAEQAMDNIELLLGEAGAIWRVMGAGPESTASKASPRIRNELRATARRYVCASA